MPSIDDFQDELALEVEAILATSFTPIIKTTQFVPNISDTAITFPNLDRGSIGCKLLKSAILYIDIRGSTILSLRHRPETMTKLYSAFVRAMVKCADYYGGKVRGVIGDRVMVIFDSESAAIMAVETAILMNSVVKMVLNKLFLKNSIKCGIGIDYGEMLVTKTGVIRYGSESSSYKSLVWLGRAANVASKLADTADKQHRQEKYVVDEVHVHVTNPSVGGLSGLMFPGATYTTTKTKTIEEFVNSFVRVGNNTYSYIEPTATSFIPRIDTVTHTSAPILATDRLVKQYRSEYRSLRTGYISARKWRAEPSWIIGMPVNSLGCWETTPALRRTMVRLLKANKK